MSENSMYFREDGSDYHLEPGLFNISFLNGNATVFVLNLADFPWTNLHHHTMQLKTIYYIHN